MKKIFQKTDVSQNEFNNNEFNKFEVPSNTIKKRTKRICQIYLFTCLFWYVCSFFFFLNFLNEFSFSFLLSFFFFSLIFVLFQFFFPFFFSRFFSFFCHTKTKDFISHSSFPSFPPPHHLHFFFFVSLYLCILFSLFF